MCSLPKSALPLLIIRMTISIGTLNHSLVDVMLSMCHLLEEARVLETVKRDIHTGLTLGHAWGHRLDLALSVLAGAQLCWAQRTRLVYDAHLLGRLDDGVFLLFAIGVIYCSLSQVEERCW